MGYDASGNYTGEYRDSPPVDKLVQKGSNSSSVIRLIDEKSPDPTKSIMFDKNGEVFSNYVPQKEQNILNNFRSYTYNFTLAALSPSEFNNPESYINADPNSLTNVVLTSKGKPTSNIEIRESLQKQEGTPQVSPPVTGLNNWALTPKLKATLSDSSTLNPPTNPPVDRQEYADSYNKTSAGRFDMFIDDVVIDTMISNNKQTSTAIAFSFSFDVIEPYSVFGFFEAMQMAAVATGYNDYISAYFVLAIDFIGYPNRPEMPDPVSIDGARRFFPIKIYDVQTSVTERGTVYKCLAAPATDQTFSFQNSTAPTPIKFQGTTVKEQAKQVVDAFQDEAAIRAANAGTLIHDLYEVRFPLVNENGETAMVSGDNKIASAEFKKSTSNGGMKELDSSKKSGAEGRQDPGQFNVGANIQSILESIVQKSSYISDVTDAAMGQTDANKVVDSANQMQFFKVVPKTEIRDIINPLTGKNVTKHIYLIIPSKTSFHHTPGSGNRIPNKRELESRALRRYDYIYTGLNKDVLDFKIEYNLAHIEAILPGAGHTGASAARQGPSTTGGQDPKIKNDVNATPTPKTELPNNKWGATPHTGDARPGDIPTATEPNRGNVSAQMARLMFNNIINTDTAKVTGDMTIVGDPYFLISGGSGNYIPKNSIQGEYAGNGEAAALGGDVYFLFNFYNPVDIDQGSGLLQIENTPTAFSGIYQALVVSNQFKDGAFKQTIQFARIPTPVDPRLPQSSLAPWNTAPNKDDAKADDSSAKSPKVSTNANGVVSTAVANAPPSPFIATGPVAAGFINGNPTTPAQVNAFKIGSNIKLANPLDSLKSLQGNLQSTLQSSLQTETAKITGALTTPINSVKVAAATSPLAALIKIG